MSNDKARILDDDEAQQTRSRVAELTGGPKQPGVREPAPHADAPIESKTSVITSPRDGLPDPPRTVDSDALTPVIGAARRSVTRRGPLTTADVADRIGHPTSVTYAALLTLLEAGDVEVRTPTGTAPSDVPEFVWR